MADLEKETEGKDFFRFRAAPLLIGTLCLGVGWFGHGFQVAQANKEADAVVPGKGAEAAGPCKTWADTICGHMGEQAYECTHARAAGALLSASACVQAQESVLARIDVLKAERVQCDELTSKLCNDLGPEGKGCELVMNRSPGVAAEDCEEMMGRYKQILEQLMSRQTKGTLPKTRVERRY